MAGRKRRRKHPVSVGIPTPVEILRVPLGQEATLPVPSFSVVLGACLMPAPGHEGFLVGSGHHEVKKGPLARVRRAAGRAWQTIHESSLIVLVDGDDLLNASCAEDVAAEPGSPVPFRTADTDPRVLTPREDGVSVQTFLSRGSRVVTVPEGWEVWVHVAR